MPFTKEQLNRSRDVLLEKRANLVRQVERLAQDAAESTEATENSKSPLNSADNAADAYEQDFAFISMESEEEILRKVDVALQRIRDKTYGQCDECGKEINAERLDYLPWATLCIKCQELEERGIRRRKAGREFEIDDDGEEALIGDDKERA
ncbi:MAG TPA: TraR/DksA family transcriptional regulator [Planctomycetota bacterium]|nr:TraR/DksA family transcriptional regulator [Planctomycetota bacterium]